MPYRDGENWTGQVQIGTRPNIEFRKRKRGFKTKRAAAEWEKRIKEEFLIPPTEELAVSSISKGSLEYIKYCSKRTKVNTYRQKIAIYTQMIEFWNEDPPIVELHSKLFLNFLDHIFETKGGTTANRYLREINSLLKWLIEQEYASVNLAARIQKYKTDPFRKYVPPREDIQAVLQVANAFEKDVLRAIFHSLARAGEIRRMKWSDCDFKKTS